MKSNRKNTENDPTQTNAPNVLKALEKGEAMKGLLNNQEAVNIVNRIDSMLENRLHQLYNLGYKQGYEDGHYDCIWSLTEQILAERRTDDSNT